MRLRNVLILSASLSASTHTAHAAEAADTVLQTVIITANRVAPTSLPTQIPTTMEGITKEQIEATVNATDAEDAIKYFPSLLVRKRYIGDYNHAVLSSRASGTGNSARSAVYADGVLLSNYLGNGATYAPRWMLVTPEEIERVDVMYGPFSAAYPGNSAGAIVDFVTRMPDTLEAHAKLTYFTQPSYDLYNTHDSYNGQQFSASLGDRVGNFSWWINANHLHSHSQPLTFPNKPISTTLASASDVVVSGAVFDKDRSNKPWVILGTATEYTTLQDHAKLKLAYDIAPTLRASYVLGYWHNDATNRPQSYLQDGSGNAVYSGDVNINGYHYIISNTDFNLSNETFTHLTHGVSLKSHYEGTLDFEVAATLFDYRQDQQRMATAALPNAINGGAGTLSDLNGTSWNSVTAKGVWRPSELGGAHIVDFGVQQDTYELHILKSKIAGNWLSDPASSLDTDVGGKTRTQAMYVQDAWHFADAWKTVLGVRAERWRASDGFTRTSTNSLNYAPRTTTYLSPKAALAWQINSEGAIKFSLGRAVRMPTVNELYGATSGGALSLINDPTLRPEKSWTSELTWEQTFGATTLRLTGFYEVVRDSLYSASVANGGSVVTRVMNVGKIATPGMELSILSNDVFIKEFDLLGSVTYADSRIKENNGYVSTPGDTIGKYQPRVPVWRATTLASHRINEQWNVSLGARYSGDQYSTLNNSDPNGFAYTGASRYFTVDTRVLYRMTPHWTASLGIDNLNDAKYWNFHPYPQRTFLAELNWDL